MTLELEQIGDYAILRELSRGFSGRSVLAEHRLLKRPFALKLLPEVSVEQVRRFEQQVSQLAQLKHPYLMPIHSATLVQDQLCLISDWLDGEWISLQQWLSSRGGQVSEEEAFPIVKQVATVLDFLHSQSPPQVHGSVRLNTIYLSSAGTGGIQVRIVDYGWSSIMGHVESMTALQQALSCQLGVEAPLVAYPFLSPEQRKGIAPIPASDVYAFGVLVYTLLMGEFPEGMFDLPTQKLGPLLRPWDRIVSECLRTDPRRRPIQLLKLLEAEAQPSFEAASKQEAFGLRGPVSSAVKPFTVEKVVSAYSVPKENVDRATEPLHCPMAPIPGGKVFRGSDLGQRDEAPRHAVHLDSFWMDVHPVTNEQYLRFLEALGSEKDAQNNDLIRFRESRIKRVATKLMLETGYAQHPVVGVTWYGAHAYAEWAGKRLPTEAEWEVASLGNHPEANYPTGLTIDKTQANFFSSDTTPVMSYGPNDYGLFDMSGNVYEWCADWYAYNYYDISSQEPDRPQGPPQGIYRVLRGGCWRSVKEDLRCAHRHRNNPGAVNSTYGFRCASSHGA